MQETEFHRALHRRPRQTRPWICRRQNYIDQQTDGNCDDAAVGRFHDGCAIQRLQDCQSTTIVSLVRGGFAVIGSGASMKWLEQCRVTETIKKGRYGLRSAFDYLVSEKLLDFARAAEREPELARQLPRFVSEVRRIFQADEIRFQLARVEREQEAQELVSHDEEIFGEDEVFSEDPEISAARARSFKLIRQLLLAPQLGTS